LQVVSCKGVTVTPGIFLNDKKYHVKLEDYGDPEKYCFKFSPATVDPPECGPPVYKFSTDK
jgi:hypothetical protein